MLIVDIRIGGINMGFIKGLFNDKDETQAGNGNEYYDLKPEEAMTEEGGAKMILLEPRAYSEAQQIADHLKKRNTVVVNLKRVTSDQAKRIMDFLSGTIYAIKGNIQKIGNGIFLCTPNNINVQGKITDDNDKENDKSKEKEEDNINYEW
jgi:FtsZ-interacting cell division protein YlmF